MVVKQNAELPLKQIGGTLRSVAATLLAVVTAIVANQVPAAADDTVPPELEVVVVARNGSGCPKDDAQTNPIVDPSDDHTSLKFTFTKYLADSAASLTKACSVLLDIQHSGGYAWAPTLMTYLGRVELPEGAMAVQTSSYFFQGDPDPAAPETRFAGPVYADYQSRDESKSQTWSQCGPGKRYFYVKSSVAVLPGSGDERAWISIHTQGVETSKLKLKWKKC